jgi:hypothetical protein
MPVIEIVEFEKYKEQGYKGTFVNGCIKRGDGSSFRARAHAHNDPIYPCYGWICVRSVKRVFIKGTNKPSKLMLHELAHILSKSGHDKKWAKKVKELGGAINARYKKYKGVTSAL